MFLFYNQILDINNRCVIQVVSDMGSLLLCGPQVGSVISWPLPQTRNQRLYIPETKGKLNTTGQEKNIQ